MKSRDFMLEGYGLTTAEIRYHLPDYPALLQLYLWQDYDVAPTFPALHGFLDFTDDDLGEGWCHRLELFDLQAGHGEGIGELLGIERRVAEFAQPGFWKLHGETLFLFLWLMTGTARGSGYRRRKTGAGR